MIRAGLLDRTITIERETVTVDRFGTTASTWSTVATLRAELVRQDADEQSSAAANTLATFMFRTRFFSIKLTDRLIYDGTFYDIEHVAELGRRRGLEIVARRTGS